MAVKKYENGAFIRCTKELNSTVSRCIDVDTYEPFGRTSGEYDLVIFNEPHDLVYYPYRSESVMIKGFCYDEIELDGRRILECSPEKRSIEYSYKIDREEDKNVEKYF